MASPSTIRSVVLAPQHALGIPVVPPVYRDCKVVADCVGMPSGVGGGGEDRLVVKCAGQQLVAGSVAT